MAKRTVLLLLVEETDDTTPSHDHATYDVEGAAVDEISRVVPMPLRKCAAVVELARRVAK